MVRVARLDDATVRALTVDSLVSVDARWRRSWWCEAGAGFAKAEGGERGAARGGVSRESTEPVRLRERSGARGSSRTMGRGGSSSTSIGSGSSVCLMLAGGEGGGGPTGVGKAASTTCMTGGLKSRLRQKVSGWLTKHVSQIKRYTVHDRRRTSQIPQLALVPRTCNCPHHGRLLVPSTSTTEI